MENKTMRYPLDSATREAIRRERMSRTGAEMYALLKEIRKWMDVDISEWDQKFVDQIDAVLAKVDAL